MAKTSKTIAVHDSEGNLRGSLATGGKNVPTVSMIPMVLPGKPVHGRAQDIEIIIDPVRIERIRKIKYQIGIKDKILEFIQDEVKNNPALREAILGGKEVGHTISSHIDVATSEFLKSAGYPVKYEVYSGTEDKTKRSFGDIWIEEDGKMNPINIKTGILGKGNPNMVSMERVRTSFVVEKEIEAYYLAIIKFSVNDAQEITPVVYFIDALNFIDYLNYNMGPGQIMMKEASLYEAVEENPGLTLTREQKESKLKALYAKALEVGRIKVAEHTRILANWDSVDPEVGVVEDYLLDLGLGDEVSSSGKKRHFL